MSTPKVRPGTAVTVEARAIAPGVDAAGSPTQLEVPLPNTPDVSMAALVTQAHESRDFSAARSVWSRLKTDERVVDRAALLARLAQVFDDTFGAPALALDCWLLAHQLAPAEAAWHWPALHLASLLNDEARWEPVAREWLAAYPADVRSRWVRLELAAWLERRGDADTAVTWLQQSVALDASDADAWNALADRLVPAGRLTEAMEAYEQVVATSGELPQQLGALTRLARLARLHCDDEARAQRYLEKHRILSALVPRPLPPGPSGLPLVMPPQGEGVEPVEASDAFEDLAAKLEARREPEDRRLQSDVVTAEAPDPTADADETAEARAPTTEVPALGDPAISLVPSFGPRSAKALTAERQALFDRVNQNPLEAVGYLMLAEHYDAARDVERSALMLEIGRALEGDPAAAPRAPRLILNAGDRAGLKHPLLRGPEGEYLSLVGLAMCRLYPAKGRDAGTAEEFTLQSGKGARAATDALVAAVRILGLRAPEVFMADDAGPPFSLVFTGSCRLLVGRQAARKVTPDAELRFFAGRALFTQLPELLVARSLRRDLFTRALHAVQQVLEGASTGAEARVIRQSLSTRGYDRLRTLHREVGATLEVSRLIEGARHSSNRAGLVVCGAVAPAIEALRAKKALPAEMAELIRFAGSDRYLQLRNRKL